MTWTKLNKNAVIASRNFAQNMTTGNGYVHAVRRGGTQIRGQQSKFWDTFQGKLAECAFYGMGVQNHISIEKPDFTVGGSGYIDNGDFIINDKHISIKSGRPNASYLLLETKSFNTDALETTFKIPVKNDAFCFIRVAWLEKDGNLLSINKIPEDILNSPYLEENVYINFAGFLSFERFKAVVEQVNKQEETEHFIKKGSTIGRKGVTMDADNYIFKINHLAPISGIWYYLGLNKE